MKIFQMFSINRKTGDEEKVAYWMAKNASQAEIEFENIKKKSVLDFSNQNLFIAREIKGVKK